jgi:hypothetical protein
MIELLDDSVKMQPPEVQPQLRRGIEQVFAFGATNKEAMERLLMSSEGE